MLTHRLLGGMVAGLVGALCLAASLQAAASVADAAMAGDHEAVRALLKDGADVNATQGDGVTALHWAARRGDAELARMLIVAGANPRATTRFGDYTPLHLAAERGAGDVVAALVAAGANPDALTTTGASPLMLAAGAGDIAAITALVDAGADVNAAEADRGQTPLMFAAAANRAEAVTLLLRRGADANKATHVVDLMALSADGSNPDGRNLPRESGGPTPAPARAGRPENQAAPRVRTPGVDRQYLINELVYASGGFTPIHYAARQGYMEVAAALLESGVDVNQPTGGDHTSPLLVATINGRFDMARMLLERGADPNLAAENGATPLYAAINVQWAPKAAYPQPRAHLNQKTDYLTLMKLLLEKGADPNVRLTKKVWYSGYNFDQSGVDEVGATPFWRAAYGADVDAMKLLVSYGADPSIPTIKPPGRPQTGDVAVRQLNDVSGQPPVPVGGPAVPPIIAAAGVGFGEGFAANSYVSAPGGQLNAIKYLVEVVHADVNARDHEGNTPLHMAASRGDVEMIQYLYDHGADPTALNREGQTTADMANGPVQRTQPYPEAVALLEKLGSKNNHKCLSC
ncbi:MAG: ankyrin repeat domain-containing protein [Vicinamibacterales bacterium]